MGLTTDTVEKKIRELEDIVRESIQNEMEKEDRQYKRNQSNTDL